ncbi:MAG TPA: hypothetical protein VFS10_18865 [Pyrinomonadaceae bacterium]|nr:hypothetical protein [Pyrinomonadaceae bacterium]
MRARYFLISLALVALFFTTAARAQTTGAGGQAQEAEPDAHKALEGKALELLRETVAAARGLKLAENRARVLAHASGLLWTHDERAARALFKEATEALVAFAAAPGDRPPNEGTYTLSQLRQEMLSLVVNRDAQLAIEFVRATRQPSPGGDQNRRGGGGGRPHDPELALEISLTTQLAAQDPKTALRLAEESLDRGLSSGLGRVLHLLAAKDPEGASRLAGLVIKKLNPEDLVGDYEATSVATHLLNSARPVAPRPAGDSGFHTVELGFIKIDERARRQLIETVIAAALSERAARTGYHLYHALQPILPEVEKYFPARLPALRRQSAEFERNLDPHSRMQREYREVFEQGTVEAIVEAASKAPAEMRDQLYMQAFWRTASEGDGERARQIAEHVSDPQQRAQLLQDLARQLPWRAFERGNYEEARQLIMRLPVTDERLPLLLQLVGGVLAKGDKDGARALLEEAAGLLGGGEGRAQNHPQFNAQLEIARLYAQLDEGRAFQLVELSAQQLNELIAAAAVLEGFYQDAFKDGELKQQGGHVWSDLITRCSTALAQLAPNDFERARSTVERFQRVDVRVTAQLAFVRDVLGAATRQDNQLRLENRRAKLTARPTQGRGLR